MRVLLIATNRHDQLMSRMSARPLPIGMAYVAGALAASQHTVKTLDLMFSDDYLGDVEQAVRQFQPDLVGISMRNLGNHSYLNPQWDLPISKEVVAKVRSLTRAPVVCGGPAFSILPRAIFAYVEPDFGLAGDAAEALAQLADSLAENVEYRHLPGLVYRQDSDIVMNDSLCTSTFSIPPRLDDLDMHKYAQAGFGIGVVTKLGSFYYPTSKADAEQEAWRVIRPIADVVQEVRSIYQRYGLRKVFFIDNAFNVPVQHAKDLCRTLIDEQVNVRWNSCLAPFGCDTELIGLMKQAGCALVIMGGLRGGAHDRSELEAQLAPILETCRMCEAQDLHYTISFTFGEPGDTRETVETKLNFLRTIQPAMANLRVGVSVLPGTAVARQAQAEGLITDEDDLIKPTFYLAAPVRDWIVDYLQAEKAQHPRWNLL